MVHKILEAWRSSSLVVLHNNITSIKINLNIRVGVVYMALDQSDSPCSQTCHPIMIRLSLNTVSYFRTSLYTTSYESLAEYHHNLEQAQRQEFDLFPTRESWVEPNLVSIVAALKQKASDDTTAWAISMCTHADRDDIAATYARVGVCTARVANIVKTSISGNRGEL